MRRNCRYQPTDRLVACIGNIACVDVRNVKSTMKRGKIYRSSENRCDIESDIVWKQYLFKSKREQNRIFRSWGLTAVISGWRRLVLRMSSARRVWFRFLKTNNSYHPPSPSSTLNTVRFISINASRNPWVFRLLKNDLSEPVLPHGRAWKKRKPTINYKICTSF